MNNWIEISEQRLSANFHVIEDAAGPATTLLAVIKANAYGHGAAVCAPILVRAGARWLGVTSAEEGARVRLALEAAGLDCSNPDHSNTGEQQHPTGILIMSGFLPEDVPLIHQHALVPVVWTADHIAWLRTLPGQRVHVEVDTGMGRQGVEPGAPLELLLADLRAANLMLDGLFTHFCSSEIAGAPITRLQQQRFAAVLEDLSSRSLTIPWLHACNSSALDNPPPHPDWLAPFASRLNARLLARTGLALYGYCLPIEPPETALSEVQPEAPSGIPSEAPPEAQPRLRPHLAPVLTWKARILATRDLAPGDTVGYNATFTATRPMRIALLPAGYADGLRRELSAPHGRPGGWTLIAGHRAPILGRISMNLTVVDITHLPQVTPGDEAILLGDGITADDHATLAHTIAYEILCGIHPCT